jgi:hypothetical protein
MPMKASPTFCVESGAFSVEEGEEAQTNPGVYGKAFAKWLADRFQEAGRSVDSVVPEDWGWCVILQQEPFPLWVGCGNENGSSDKWKAFVVAEGGIFRKVFGNNDIAENVRCVKSELQRILKTAPGATRTWTE